MSQGRLGSGCSGAGGTGGLSKEVYAKIREVDNQTSTLTHAGVQGLSARILDKYTLPSPRG